MSKGGRTGSWRTRLAPRARARRESDELRAGARGTRAQDSPAHVANRFGTPPSHSGATQGAVRHPCVRAARVNACRQPAGTGYFTCMIVAAYWVAGSKRRGRSLVATRRSDVERNSGSGAHRPGQLACSEPMRHRPDGAHCADAALAGSSLGASSPPTSASGASTGVIGRHRRRHLSCAAHFGRGGVCSAYPRCHAAMALTDTSTSASATPAARSTRAPMVSVFSPVTSISTPCEGARSQRRAVRSGRPARAPPSGLPSATAPSTCARPLGASWRRSRRSGSGSASWRESSARTSAPRCARSRALHAAPAADRA